MNNFPWRSFTIRFGGLGLIFLSQVILARMMGPKDFGTYTVIMTWLNIVVVFSLCGFDLTAQRFFSLYRANNDEAHMRGFLRFSTRLILTVSFICIVVLFCLLLNRARHFSLTYSQALFWSLFLIPLLAIINQCSALLRAIKKIQLSLIFIYIIIPVAIIGSALLYYYNYNLLRYDAAMMLYLISCVFITFIIYGRLRKEVRINLFVEPLYEKRKWLSASAVFFAMSLSALLIKQLDILMLSHYTDNTTAGIYSAAVRFSALVPFGLIVIDYIFTPQISILYTKNDHLQFQKSVTYFSKLILLITIPVAAILIVTGRYLLMLYGPQFVSSYLPLIILVAGQMIYALAGIAGPLLTMTGNQNVFILVYFSATLIDLALNMVLIPQLGATGAAISTSCSAIALSVMLYLVVKKKLGLRAAII